MAALRQTVPRHQLREAVSTTGLYHQISGAHLVIADLEGPEAIVEDTVSIDTLRQLLVQQGVCMASTGQFLLEPEAWVKRARSRRGELQVMEPTAIAWLSASGGVGKTSLAIAMARVFAHKTRLPTAIIEFTHAVSAFQQRLDPGLPTLHPVVTGSESPGKVGALTAVAMDPELDLHVLPEEFDAWFQHFRRDHVLTVCDVALPQPLFETLVRRLDRVIVVADPRPEAAASARRLVDRIRSQSGASTEVHAVLNRSRPGDRLAYRELNPSLTVPYSERVEQSVDVLARPVLRWLFPQSRW